ncbi:hypothetical protein CRE_32633 [Caenorhabditis remanei]|uniref:Uncharacterized protein n=1 Tax=Caenorhabditis remanei TaxID=31234 RepID=E3LFZ8_CAERE|nr:hypothetical protein CRE_32633 [Caenorhabditis remanei]
MSNKTVLNLLACFVSPAFNLLCSIICSLLQHRRKVQNHIDPASIIKISNSKFENQTDRLSAELSSAARIRCNLRSYKPV